MSDASSGPSNPRVVSSTISLSVYSVLGLVLGLVTTILITHKFPSDAFGIYTLILVVISFLGQISTLGIETSVPRFIAGAKDDARKEQFFGVSIILRGIVVVVAGLLAWFGSPLLTSLFGQSLLPQYVLYVPLLFALESFRSLFRAILQGCLVFSKIGMSDLILSLSNLVLLIGFIFGTERTITVLILIRALSSIAASVFAFVAIPIKKRLIFRADIFKEVIGFGFPLQINDILGFIFLRIDTVVIAAFLGPTDIALYEVARKIPDSLRNLYTPFRSVFYPILAKISAEGDQAAIAEFLSHALRILAFITLLGAGISLLFGQEIIRLLFSAAYDSSAPIFAVLMINLCFSLMGNIMGTTIVALGDSKKPMIINSVNAAASWIGAVILVPLDALMGAATATTLGTILAVPLNVLFLKRLAQVKDSAYLKPVLVFGVWAAIVLATHPTPFWLKSIYLFAFILGCGFLSIYTRQDLDFLIAESQIAAALPLQKIRLWASRK